MMESMGHAGGMLGAGARDLGARLLEGSSETVLYGAALAAARFALRNPLIVLGVGAAAAIGYSRLKPATRRKAIAQARELVGRAVESRTKRARNGRSSKRSSSARAARA